MKEIFQEYGGILITVVAILAVIVVITAVIGKDENGAIGQAFMQIINNFVAQANANTGVQYDKEDISNRIFILYSIMCSEHLFLFTAYDG